MDDLPLFFPGLETSDYSVTSPASTKYNCVAWAVRDQTRWWWPDPLGLHYWPAAVERRETIEAFISAFRELGFETCSDGDLEPDFEKITIYVSDGRPRHIARQLKNGSWTSKLGPDVDIRHEINALMGNIYGEATYFLKRSW